MTHDYGKELIKEEQCDTPALTCLVGETFHSPPGRSGVISSCGLSRQAASLSRTCRMPTLDWKTVEKNNLPDSSLSHFHHTILCLITVTHGHNAACEQLFQIKIHKMKKDEYDKTRNLSTAVSLEVHTSNHVNKTWEYFERPSHLLTAPLWHAVCCRASCRVQHLTRRRSVGPDLILLAWDSPVRVHLSMNTWFYSK